MKFYPEGYNVEVVVGFTDLNGAPVIPIAINAVLTDGDDAVVVEFSNLPIEQDATSKSIMIPSAFNNLEEGELRAARILRVELVTSAGSIRRSHSYIIEAEQRLDIMTNTFQTYEAAMIQSLDVPNITGWTNASEEQRKAALVEAYRRLVRIPMKFPTYGERINWSGYDKIFDRDIRSETIITRDGWEEVTKDLYGEFPSSFKRALRRAQFLEASELLQGDNAGQKHRAGIVTETIGESSVTLRAGRVDYGVSSQTLHALTGFIHFNMRTIRA